MIYTKAKKRRPRGHGPEHQIQNAIREVLTLRGHQVFRANVGMMSTIDGTRKMSTGLPKGFPDLFGFNKNSGKMFFLEVKTATGKRRPAQIFFAKTLIDKPVIYGVVRSPKEALEIVDHEQKLITDPKHPDETAGLII